MTKTEHLLTILAEECMETAHRASKALRFGLEEIQPGQELTNAERMFQEFNDIAAVMQMLCRDGYMKPNTILSLQMLAAKRKKVDEFLAYSEKCGTLTP